MGVPAALAVGTSASAGILPRRRMTMVADTAQPKEAKKRSPSGFSYSRCGMLARNYLPGTLGGCRQDRLRGGRVRRLLRLQGRRPAELLDDNNLKALGTHLDLGAFTATPGRRPSILARRSATRSSSCR